MTQFHSKARKPFSCAVVQLLLWLFPLHVFFFHIIVNHAVKFCPSFLCKSNKPYGGAALQTESSCPAVSLVTAVASVDCFQMWGAVLQQGPLCMGRHVCQTKTHFCLVSFF